MKKLEIKIPIIHVISIMLFLAIVNLIIGEHTRGKNELYELLYSISFFITNDLISVLLGIILFIPLPLLIFFMIKKRKDLIRGFSISLLISIALIMIITLL
ncbi:hypothetical protein [Joostella sp. CR20]|uniref:hypothetical protein n=1 Tax=Joostella sp. CR20 TaxID=2804312 RepID=UPI00313DC063